MRNFLLITIAVLCSMATVTNARQLTPQQALNRALGNLPSVSVASRSGDLQLVYTDNDKSTGLSGVYVFNRPMDGGFYVVSADDSAEPLLGYSDSGIFDPVDIPSNLQAWLNEYTSQIAWASSVEALSVANAAGRPQRAPISPKCQTLWNQGAPYNDLCPLDNNERSVTGCVATAMSQVLKYHNFPAKGIGSHSYTTQTSKLSVSFDFANTTFDWSNMLDSYTSSATDAQKNAVATLMLAAGVSVDMDYTSNESGASSFAVGSALINYFGYDKSISFQQRNWYGIYEWEDLIYNSLSTCGPVILGGQSGTGGHEFVCDGYSEDGYFHINWGWGGMSNGYFLLSALDPGQQGIGGSEGGYNFNQDAIIDIKPLQSSSVATEFMASTSDLTGQAGMNSIMLYGSFVNMSYASIDCVVLGAEVNGAYYECSTHYGSVSPEMGVGEYSVNLSSLPAGTYTLRPAYKSSSSQWQLMKASLSNVNYLTITKLANGTVQVTQPAQQTVTISNLKPEAPLSPGNIFRVTATATNESGQEYVNTLYLILINDQNQVYELSQYALDVPVSESVDITVQDKLSTSIPAGTYEMCFAQSDGQGIVPLGTPLEVIVESYEAPAITISEFSIDDADGVNPEKLTVHITVSNTGGYFYGPLTVAIFEMGQNQSVSSFNSQNIEIPTNATDLKFDITGTFVSGEPGKEYFLGIFNGSSQMTNLAPTFVIAQPTSLSYIGSDADIKTINVYTTSGIKVGTYTACDIMQFVDSCDIPAGVYVVSYTTSDGALYTAKYLKR